MSTFRRLCFKLRTKILEHKNRNNIKNENYFSFDFDEIFEILIFLNASHVLVWSFLFFQTLQKKVQSQSCVQVFLCRKILPFISLKTEENSNYKLIFLISVFSLTEKLKRHQIFPEP